MATQGETITLGANNGVFGTNGYSELQVLSSAAGFYLGTTFTHPAYPEGTEDYYMSHMIEPGSRETFYFETRTSAEAALVQWNKGNKVNAR